MKKSDISHLILLVWGVLLLSCNGLSPTGNNRIETLDVKFMNSESSHFVISDIQLMAMGVAGAEESNPSGNWSDNILPEGKTIAPGGHEFFTLKIPNMHWSQYRLGVYDESGNHIMLHEQQNFLDGQLQGTITHWGSDERTVGVTVVREQSSEVISIQGYSDWAGIE